MKDHYRGCFHVRGLPKAQPRPRAFAYTAKDGKSSARMYEAGTAEAWKAQVVDAGREVRPDVPLEGPLSVSITFYLKRPKRLMRKKDPAHPIYAPCKPDRDNLEKAVLDAMTEDGWWRDDAQVVCGEVSKWYHAKDQAPGAFVVVREMGENE